MMKKSLVLTILFFSSATMAESWTERTDFSGFYSARYSIADKSAYFHGNSDTGINKDGSFQGTKIGITITSQVNDKLSVAMLLMSADDHDKYATHADWAFASYTLNDTFTLRAGKIKFPVGLINEYVDVGAAYPWISAPLLLYSEETVGPQATREAYTGSSLLWEKSYDDWTLGSDTFGGQVDLESMVIKKLIGITVRANWDDTVELQASTYQGEMRTSNMMMNGKTHQASLAGIKLDWNDIIAYAEFAKVSMDVKMMGMNVGDSDSWYTTLGYRIGEFLPHVTYQDWERGNGDNHQISTIGLSYNISDSSVIKTEWSIIKTDNYATNLGLYAEAPSSGTTNMASVAFDVMF